MKCIFCDILKGKANTNSVWENRDFLLTLVPKPINPGHLILIPKKHIDDLFNIPEPLYSDSFKMVKKIVPILKKLTRAKRIGLAVEGFGVPHAHIHLVPVNKGNELNPLRTKKMSTGDLKKMQTKFATAFKKLK